MKVLPSLSSSISTLRKLTSENTADIADRKLVSALSSPHSFTERSNRSRDGIRPNDSRCRPAPRLSSRVQGRLS
jgi:hypothetical protein